MKFLILIIASYFLGSVPFGLIIAKAHGKDLRKIGSGNIGATNLSRALGKKWAYFCFALDVTKGLLPMLVGGMLISSALGAAELSLWLAAGVAAILGHLFSIYIKFKGGKGVATSFGVAMGLWPYYTYLSLAAILVWAIAVLIWRYISLGSICASVAFTITFVAFSVLKTDWQLDFLWPLLIMAVLIPVMVIARHKENITRIIAGTEGKTLVTKK